MRNKLFWCNVLLACATYAVMFKWRAPEDSDFRIRTFGLALQLIGVVTVWFDLTSTARSLGKDGMLTRTWSWLKSGFSGNATAVMMGVSAQASASSSANATVRWPMNPNASVADRLEALEKNIGKVDEDIQGVHNQMARAEAMANAQAQEEKEHRAQAIADVRRELAVVAAGNFAVLVFGVVWLAVGLFLATWSPEFAKIIAGKWSTVWATI